MKFAIPEISWHNRDPVLSVDFQPKSEPNEPLRLATGGTDSHVLIWYISTTEKGSINLEVAADLTRHQKAVNVVRWSPNGQYLASGDDESIIIVWKQKTEDPVPPMEGEEQYKESWVIHKTLRGHMEDVLDMSWSSSSLQLASGSVDNKLLIWDVGRGRYSSIVSDHKGFVQGVAWDPRGQLIATTSTDRVFRTFDVNSKKVVSRSSKAILPFPKEHALHDVKVRLYHDDTLQTYFRRLQFSPDGLLIAVPAGRIEPEQGKLDMKPMNAVYIYTRYSLKVPVCVLPCSEPALALRWSPRRLAPRPRAPPPAFPGARRLLAVATRRSLVLYDTQQRTPVALVSNVHYTRLTDLTWSPNGRSLVASSTDGFCSVVTFNDGELGEFLPDELTEPNAEPMEVEEAQQNEKDANEEIKTDTKQTTIHNTPKIDSFIKFKTPGENLSVKKSERSPKKAKIDNSQQQKTSVKIDVLVETAMQSWSDNSSNDVIKPKEMDIDNNKDEIMVIEDSEDIKLVYDETENSKLDNQSPTENKTKPAETNKSIPDSRISPVKTNLPPKHSEVPNSKTSNFFKQAKVTDMKEPVVNKAVASPKTPRRVSFVTLSSPKNSKKK
ncbi:chromatin assembly factor 1 subunit B [Vanessa tameamea]|uniref:Chromatin assembly factor 1 subunit B n=1 Tax=Vanessa tameamea TaxID=334116 RepID=A0A8B8HPD6_VANTA|nr:chromatin assembly factor 1 subunit B [Vanessa tameamea]